MTMLAIDNGLSVISVKSFFIYFIVAEVQEQSGHFRTFKDESFRDNVGNR